MHISSLFALVNVVTLNVWGLPSIPLSTLAPYRDERIQAICSELKSQVGNPSGWDVVMIQEAWVPKDRTALANCGYPYVVDLDQKDRVVDSGVMILSRLEIDEESVGRLTYSEGGTFGNVISDGEFLARKSAIIARVRHPLAGPIWVTNTHLVAVYEGEESKDRYREARKAQMQELVDWAREKAGDEPLIIGGDLNSGKGSDLWESFLATLPAFVHSPDADGHCTYVPESWDVADFQPADATPCKFDHLFGSPHFSGVKGQVVFDRPFELDGKSVRVSDHFGWETIFQIRMRFMEYSLPELIFPFYAPPNPEELPAGRG